MSFSPNLFISNIHGKDGLAKPNRFEVVLPIPPSVSNHIGNSIIEKILNFPNSVFSDVSEAINGVLGQEPADGFSKSGNTAVSRYLALQCEAAELPGRTLATADVKIYGPTFKVPYLNRCPGVDKDEFGFVSGVPLVVFIKPDPALIRKEILFPLPLDSALPSSPPLVTTDAPFDSIRIITPLPIVATGFPSIDISN